MTLTISRSTVAACGTCWNSRSLRLALKNPASYGIDALRQSCAESGRDTGFPRLLLGLRNHLLVVVYPYDEARFAHEPSHLHGRSGTASDVNDPVTCPDLARSPSFSS